MKHIALLAALVLSIAAVSFAVEAEKKEAKSACGHDHSKAAVKAEEKKETKSACGHDHSKAAVKAEEKKETKSACGHDHSKPAPKDDKTTAAK